MPEESKLLNIYETMTANEEVYYSFMKNLQYVFSELERVEEDYANSLTRLLYFLNINNENNDKFPALELRKFVIQHLEKSRDIHLALSKDCSAKLFTPIKNLLSDDFKAKTDFENEREKNDKFYNELKEIYERGKNAYFEQAKKTTKAYRDDLHKKFKTKYSMSEYNDIKAKNEGNKKETVRLQEEWERQICSCSQKRLQYINTKKEEIKKYKEKNKDSLLKLNTILTDYFNIYHNFYVNATNMLNATKETFSKKESPIAQYDTIFDDISDWGEPPKFEFVPFISGNDQFLTSPEILPEKKKYTLDFMAIIRNYLEEFCAYQAPELFSEDPKQREDFKKIQDLANCIIEKHPQNIKKESLELMYTKKEYILFFLRSLNRSRAEIEIVKSDVFAVIQNIMMAIMDKYKDENYKNGETEQFFEILDTVIALSQAITLDDRNEDTIDIKGVKKKQIQDEVCKHEYWAKEGVWSEMVYYMIETGKVKQKISDEKNLTQRENKIMQIAYASITTCVHTMSYFGIAKEVILKMRTESCAKYHVDINTVPEYIDPEEDIRQTSFRPSMSVRDSTASNFYRLTTSSKK